MADEYSRRSFHVQYRMLVGLCVLVLGGGTVEGVAGEYAPDELVRRALQDNPGVAAAARRVDAAREAIGKANGALYPRVYTAVGLSGTDNPTHAFMMELNQHMLNLSDPAFDPNSPDDTTNLRLTLGLEYRLWDGGGRESRTGMARAMAMAEESTLAAVRNALAFEVVRAYYQVMRARAFVTVQTSSVESIESSLAAAQNLLEAGSAVRTDVLNLDVSLAEARESLIRARNATELALAALNMAIDGEEPVTLEMLPAPELPEHFPEPVEPVSGGCAQRPEAVRAEAQVGAAEQMLAGARSGRLPRIDLMASVDWDSEDGSDMEQSYLAGLVARWDLFAGGEIRYDVRQAAASRDAAEASRQDLLNRLALEMREALIRQTEARERLTVTAQSVVHSEEALRIGQNQYRQGTIRLPDLLLSQVGVTASRTRHISAYYDYLVARANVHRAGGCLPRVMRIEEAKGES